ncbi:MAG: serine hydrolase [Chitinophagales bacterium]|nr:serine hydrolase [Chitinophagales bacterium]
MFFLEEQTIHYLNLVFGINIDYYFPMKMKSFCYLFLVVQFFIPICIVKAQISPPYMSEVPKEGTIWVDSLLSSLTPEEKVAQLFMISAYSNKDENHEREIENFIRKYKIGGLIMMQGTPQKQAELLNKYQSVANIPLMIGFDGEWGLSMRLKGVVEYPRQMLLGALQNDLLIYEMGREFARQMKLTGIHFNFAPVVDVNNNANNPVINDRSFGENVQNVIKKSIMYMKGLQDGGVLACAKHFPGHGDTDIDSHYDLPVIKQSKSRLDSVELMPFKALSANGVGSMMVAHLNVPAVDNTPNLPSTLSPKIINGVLRGEIGYQGLVFTDALNMKGISKYFPSGEAEVRALLAGNDIMLFSENVPKAMEGVLAAVKSGRLSQELIDEKVKKILLAKYWLGLNHKSKLIDTSNLSAELNTDYASFLNEKLISEAITVVSDSENNIPIGDLSQLKLASVQINGGASNKFTEMLNKYGKVTHFYISKDASVQEFQSLQSQLEEYDLIIVAHFGLQRSASKKHGTTASSIGFIQQLQQKKRTINIFFGLPYVLNHFSDLKSSIIAYIDDPIAQSVAAQVVFGGMGTAAKLPVRAGNYPEGTGLNKVGGVRLRYVSPYYLGISPSQFKEIDRLAEETIQMGATPGCQIVVAYKGAVIYEKSFGKKSYGGEMVRNSDLYDIASITKITATAPVLMYMNELGKFDINKQLSDYLPSLQGNKRHLVIKDILAHQSGLPAWIPFYKKTLGANNKPNPEIYNKDSSAQYSSEVADHMFMDKRYIDTIYKDIDEVPLQEAKYRYSDLGYYYFKQIIENFFHRPLDVVADSLIWKKLGGNMTMYNPLRQGIELKNIVPSEEDNSFRMQKIQGYVNDQGAAMMGGVAGHAGLFSNANDLTKYFQMLLNKGYYGNIQFFQPQLVEKFTSRVSKGNRRALAFDKSAINGSNGPSCDCVSDESFGHTGFTGTIAWADPKNEVIFIFLSNRTYPNPDNRLLINQNIRPKMQQIIYNIIGKSTEE